MAIRTYKVTLDSKNTIAPEPIYLRQGDKTGAVVIDATLMDNGVPVSLDGLTPMFKANTADGQAVIADSTGFNIVNAAGGKFTYQVPSQLGSVAGKIQIAYFSFSDSAGAQSTFNVAFIVKKAADMTKESAKDWISILSDIIEQYNQWSNDAHNSWEQFVDDNKSIIESIDPGGKVLSELIGFRHSDMLSKTFDTAKLRGDFWDEEFRDRGINVKWFGAIGDGIHDDTNAIQNALESGGKIIFDENKTYVTTSPLIVREKTSLIGNFSEIKYIGPVVNDHGIFEIAGSFIYFYHLIINGNIVNQINSGNINQHSYTITESKGIDGIRSSQNVDISDVTIDECTFREIQKMGVVINTKTGKNITVKNNKFEYTNRDGSWVVGDNVAFINNVYLNSHDNAIVFDGAFGDADHNNIIIKDNIVYQSTNLVNPVDTTGESYMDGIYIGQKPTRKITDVLISNNIIKARYDGIELSYIAKNLIISENVIEMGNNNPKISTTGIGVSKSTGGIISNNKIRANAYAIHGDGSSDEFEIFGNDVSSSYIDLFGFKNSIAKSNISRGTSSSVNKVSEFTDSQIVGNNFKGVSPYFDFNDGNLYLDNYAGLTYLPGTKTKSGVSLPNNDKDWFSFDTTKFFNSFDLTRDIVDIGPTTSAGLEFVVIVLNNRTATPINVSAVKLNNFKSTTVQPGSQLTILAARYNLYTVVSQS